MSNDNGPASIEESARNRSADLARASQNEGLTRQCWFSGLRKRRLYAPQG
jgi:hypothetical protein